jgi:SAM-dependent methyltransferase
MIACRSVRRSGLALAAVLVASLAAAQGQGQGQGGQQGQFQPQVGQAGKDVVWVPTPQALVDRMLDMAKVTPQDYVIDLGSGDGRTVITAAKRGARAMGIEFDPNMVALSKANAAKEGLASKATFQNSDLFASDFSEATVLTMFLLPQINLKLRPTILQMKPGTRVVSNSFDMGEWVADETSTVSEDCTSWCTAMLWIVPAKADGTWRLGKSQLTLKQDFQVVTGTLETGGKSVPVEGRLRGADLTFTAGATQYSGRVNGDSIEGTSKAGGAETKWKATRGGM